MLIFTLLVTHACKDGSIFTFIFSLLVVERTRRPTSDASGHRMVVDALGPNVQQHDATLDAEAEKNRKMTDRKSRDHIAEMNAAEVDGDEEGDVELTPGDGGTVKMKLTTKDGYTHKLLLEDSPAKSLRDISIRLLGMDDSIQDKVRQKLKVRAGL